MQCSCNLKLKDTYVLVDLVVDTGVKSLNERKTENLIRTHTTAKKEKIEYESVAFTAGMCGKQTNMANFVFYLIFTNPVNACFYSISNKRNWVCSNGLKLLSAIKISDFFPFESVGPNVTPSILSI